MPRQPTFVPVPEPSRPPLPARIEGAPAGARSWQAQLGRRMWCWLGLKTLGISVFMWVFFIGYFHLLRNPASPPLQMPLTALDHAIPFQPGAAVAYVSLWLYVGIPPGLLLGVRPLIVYGLWAAGLCVTGLACFYFFPTAVPPLLPAQDATGNAVFALLQGVDAAGNACPSLHVAAAMFSAVWIHRLLRAVGAPATLRWVNAAWFLLIVHSTLATKQHVVLDVLAGAPLGLLFAWASLRWRPGAPHL
jgi:hypothetical protein